MIGLKLAQNHDIILAFRMNNSAANENVDCSQSLIFLRDRRCRSLSSTGRHLGLLDAS